MGGAGGHWFTKITWKKYLCWKQGLYFLILLESKMHPFTLVTKIGWWTWAFHRPAVSHLALPRFFSRWKWGLRGKHSPSVHRLSASEVQYELWRQICLYSRCQDANSSMSHPEHREALTVSTSVMFCEQHTRQVSYFSLKTSFMRS